MKLLVLLAAIVVVCNSAAIDVYLYGDSQDDVILQTPAPGLEESDNRNVVTVPNNCPPGQQLINGQCRDVWPFEMDSRNAVTVPSNCRPPQQLINGVCRDVWRFEANNVIVVPNNCPPGQQLINGRCRDVWRQSENEPFNVVTVPSNCPEGQELINGQCRDVWPSLLNEPYNGVTVPSNCPDGQQLINGQCRDVWTKQKSLLNTGILAAIENSIRRVTREADEDPDRAEANFIHNDVNRNIISVPNQCPSGHRPDALAPSAHSATMAGSPIPLPRGNDRVFQIHFSRLV